MAYESKELYLQLLEWLYANDEAFKQEWESNWEGSVREELGDSKYYGDGSDSSGWDELQEILDGWRERTTITLPSGAVVESVDYRNGGEEEGTVRWLVLKVTNEDGSEQFFKKYGYWVSHDGGYWEGDFKEVKPLERTVTYYE